MDNKPPSDTLAIETLIDIMEQLRHPTDGCPWDVEQTFRTIAPYTIEEAYEVADAIEREDMAGLKDELGDLLFQTVFHAQMAKEQGLFDFNDIAQAISNKMIRRHPHVFSDNGVRTADEQSIAWEKQKAEERAQKGLQSVLDDVPVSHAGLTRAVKLQKRASRVGFDWPYAKDVLAKIKEEIEELEVAIGADDPHEIEGELGDLIFAIANLSRKLNIDPEAALRRTNQKFIRRFQHIEERMHETNQQMTAENLPDMEVLWDEAKARER